MNKDKKSLPEPLLSVFESDLPSESRPFASLAKAHKLEEAELINLLRRFLDNGVIRRYGARIKHQKAGLTAKAFTMNS